MPCCRRSASDGNFEMSSRIAIAFVTSSLAMPAQSVAQNVKSCSALMSLMFTSSICVWAPSRPWPYSEMREGDENAARGMLHWNGAWATLPAIWVGNASGFELE